MVKRTQTIRRLLPTNCLSVFGHFAVGAEKTIASLEAIVNSYMLIVYSTIVPQQSFKGVFDETGAVGHRCSTQ